MGSCGSGGGSNDAWEVYVGVLIGMLASVSSNLGVNVQKYSFMTERKKPLHQRAPYLKQWRWWLGTVLVVLGAVFDFVSFALAPQSLIAPTGALAPVSNVFFAHFWLGEILTRRDLLGTAFIICGAILVLAFGSHKAECYTIGELKSLYGKPPMIAYVVVTVVCLGGMYLVIWNAERLLLRSRTPKPLADGPLITPAGPSAPLLRNQFHNGDSTNGESFDALVDSKGPPPPSARCTGSRMPSTHSMTDAAEQRARWPSRESLSGGIGSGGLHRARSASTSRPRVPSWPASQVGSPTVPAFDASLTHAGGRDRWDSPAEFGVGGMRRDQARFARQHAALTGTLDGRPRGASEESALIGSVTSMEVSARRDARRRIRAVSRTMPLLMMDTHALMAVGGPIMEGMRHITSPANWRRPRGFSSGARVAVEEEDEEENQSAGIGGAGAGGGSAWHILRSTAEEEAGEVGSGGGSIGSFSSHEGGSDSDDEVGIGGQHRTYSDNKHARRLAALLQALEDPPPEYVKYTRLHPVLYGVLSGSIGAQTVLFAKSCAEILKATVLGENQFKFFLSYVLLFAMVGTIVMQQHALANGLQLFDALLIVPIFSSLFMGVSIISGGVYFDEFSGFKTQQIILFPCGVLLTLFGVYILSGRRKAELERTGDSTALKDSSINVSDYGSVGYRSHDAHDAWHSTPTLTPGVRGREDMPSLRLADWKDGGSQVNGEA